MLRLQTIQTVAFRCLIELLKDILIDVNFVFDEHGMSLITMDNRHTVLVQVLLKAEHFEEYRCSNRTIVGLNLGNLFRLIKSLSASDVLALEIDKNDPTRLIVEISNADKKTFTRYKLNQLDLDEVKIDIPQINFDTRVSISASELQRLARDMAQLSEHVTLAHRDSCLCFEVDGNYASQVTELAEFGTSGLQFLDRSDENTIFGTFSVKYLSIFTRASLMASNATLSLKPEYPLVIEYPVASLGSIVFVLGATTI